MTDRGQPGAQGSTLRNIEAGEASQTLSDGFIVPSTETTLSSQRYADLDESQYAEFDASYSSSSLDVTIEAGEAFIKGWLARDTQTTVTLTDFTDNQTVVLAWDADSVYDDSIHNSREDADSVIITLESDLPTLEVPYIPIWEFDTDGTGVTDARDLRTIGKTIQETQMGALEAEDGDRVDMRSDSFENAGHDEVDIPQVRNLTVANWESGRLDDNVWTGNNDAFEVQDSVVSEGSYALKGDTREGRSYLTAFSGVGSYPQAGDKWSCDVYIVDDGSKPRIYFGVQEDGSEIPISYAIVLHQGDDALRLRKYPGFELVVNDNIDIPLEEWLTVEVEWGVDGVISATLIDSNDSVLGSFTTTDESYKSGAVGFMANHPDSINAIQYFDNWTVSRRETESASDTQKGTTEAGNELTPSGAVHTGPRELSENATRGEVATAPVTDQATQGEQSLLTLLRSGVSPAAYVERTMDGQGGAYGHQIQGALGRWSRINSNLSFEYGSLADTDWSSSAGPASFSFALTGNPRQIEVSHDGSGDGFGGVQAGPVVSPGSLGGFRVTFHNVDVSLNDTANTLNIGLSDEVPDSRTDTFGNGVVYTVLTGTQYVKVIDGDADSQSSGSSADLSSPVDITIEYVDGTARLYLDGVLTETLNSSFSGNPRPVVQYNDNGTVSTGETVTVEQVTVEPLPEVLQ